MIQRVQSIWLLLAALTILSLLIVSSLSAASVQENFILYGFGIKSFASTADVSSSSCELLLSGLKVPASGVTTNYNIPLFISVVLAGLINIVNIFNFRNRKLQVRIILLNIILILGLSFWLSKIITSIPNVNAVNVEIGIAVPLVAIIFNLLAMRGIKKDEKLIKSADRLR